MAFILLLAVAVGALALGAGWISINALLGGNRVAQETQAAAKPTPAVAGISARPTPAPEPTPIRPPAVVSVPDWGIPKGYFFTETNGAPPLSSALGYAVTNEEGIPFWDQYNHLGGLDQLGYPLSGRFEWNGLQTQVFQRAVLQWNPAAYRVQAANVMDVLHDQGRDQWLFEEHATPRPLLETFDQGTNTDVANNRFALLEADPAMFAFYKAAPDGLTLYGLPASLLTDMGDHVAIRLQRGVLQRWTVDRPWAKAGQVSAANVGQIAKEAGLFPPESFELQNPPVTP